MPEEPWLKICHRLPEDPAVIGIAERTGLDQDTVCGKLLRLWIWADQNLVDGNARSVTPNWLDRNVRCSGFASAMEAEHWLVIEPDGLVFPKFEKHMGSSAKKRAMSTVRVQRYRAQACNASSVTKALPEKRRGENKISPPTPPKKSHPKRDFWIEALGAMSGPALKTDCFREAWFDWIGHQRERGKVPTPRAVVGQIRKAEPWGELRAIAAIRHSIAGNYQGLFEPKETKPDTRTGAQAPPGKWKGR